jgi:SPP1 family predicted phage head-tail adaptor
MQAGDLDLRITLETLVDGEDEYGEPVQEYQLFKKVWGKYKPLSGRDYWEAQKVNSELAGEITIRYLPTIQPTMRASFVQSGLKRTFEIESYYHIDKRWTVLRVKEVLGDEQPVQS